MITVFISYFKRAHVDPDVLEWFLCVILYDIDAEYVFDAKNTLFLPSFTLFALYLFRIYPYHIIREIDNNIIF